MNNHTSVDLDAKLAKALKTARDELIAEHPGAVHGYLAAQFGEAITAARTKTGLSQRAQAKRLGVAGNTLRELELGLANPTLARIEEVAVGLGLTVTISVKARR